MPKNKPNELMLVTPAADPNLQSDAQEPEVGLPTTVEIFPVKGIARDCLTLNTGRVSTIFKVEGLDTRLMSEGERAGMIRRRASLFSSLNSPFSFYCVTRPRNMQGYLDNLERWRQAERSEFRQQYWVEYSFVRRLNEENSLTRRDYYVAVQATEADMRSSELTTENGERKSFLHTFKERFQVAVLGKDPGEVSSKAKNTAKASPLTRKADTHIIPAQVADQLRFRAQSLADQLRLGARLLTAEELTTTLGELLESPLAFADPEEVGHLERISGAEYEETPNYVRFGSTYAASLYVTDIPKSVRPDELFDLIRFKDIELLLALHARPLDNLKAEGKLKNRQQILFAVAANDQSYAGDMSRSYKLESIRDIRGILARGDARLFSVGIRLAVKAKSKTRLFSDLRRVKQRLEEMGFNTATATKNQRRAFFSCLPLGNDWLGQEKLLSDRVLHPNLTGENLACLLPNCIVDFTQPGGIILGVSKADGSLITYNRWLLTNPHSVICATSGGGKTVSMLIELMREMLASKELECYYIDPQGVLGSFASLVGGTVIDLGPSAGCIINPMDRYVLNGKPASIGERLTFLIPLFELMLQSELGATERAGTSRAVKRLYHHFEDGESMLGVLEANYANHPLYAPIRHRTREVMAKLRVIYAELREKYKIPQSGLVKGNGTRRPICHLEHNRWIYRGEGETTEPLTSNLTSSKSSNPTNNRIRPAEVWYADTTWFRQVKEEFTHRVLAEKVFEGLDQTALIPAIRDALVELCLGMPILSDLMPFLAAEGLVNLVSNLDQFVDPEIFGKLFNGYTNVALDRRFISFNVRDLGEELLRPIRIFQTIDFTWGMARGLRKKRLFVCDEFGLLVQNFSDVGNYIRNLFMRGRYFGLSMTVIVQNMTSLLDYPAALQCVENAERFILLRQQQTAIHRLQTHFGLTDGQVDVLVNAEPGEALQRIAGRWVHVKYAIPPEQLSRFDTRISDESEVVSA